MVPTMDTAGFEPARGGDTFEMINHYESWGSKTGSAWKSLQLYPVSQQYIPKGNQTPASKLAFVKNVIEWKSIGVGKHVWQNPGVTSIKKHEDV